MAQTAQFGEVTVVLVGEVVVQPDQGAVVVAAGPGLLAGVGEQIRCAFPKGARYIAVRPPAFSPGTVNREDG